MNYVENSKDISQEPEKYIKGLKEYGKTNLNAVISIVSIALLIKVAWEFIIDTLDEEY